MEIEYPAAGHLSEKSRQLWAELVPSRAKSPGRRVLLQTALEALDRADEAREAIAASGLTTTTKTTGAVHVHPLVKVEREARQQFAKIWSDLHFDFDGKVDGRNPFA